METADFNSSNLQSGTYNQATEQMTITFKNGRTYLYQGIQHSIWLDLLSAPSAGSYFARTIRPNATGTEI